MRGKRTIWANAFGAACSPYRLSRSWPAAAGSVAMRLPARPALAPIARSRRPGRLPAANPGRQSEQGVTPADETRGTTPPIGSVVATKGGQRAQKEAADKAAADRDAKEREQRNAADRDAKAKQQSAPQTTPTEFATGRYARDSGACTRHAQVLGGAPG